MYFASHKKILESLSLFIVAKKKVSFHGVSFIPSWDPENVPEAAGSLRDKASFLGELRIGIIVHHQIWVNRITTMRSECAAVSDRYQAGI